MIGRNASEPADATLVLMDAEGRVVWSPEVEALLVAVESVLDPAVGDDWRILSNRAATRFLLLQNAARTMRAKKGGVL